MNLIKPHITLLVLLCIGLLCGVLMFVFPESGIAIGSYKLKFKTWHKLADTTSVRKIEDVEKYLSQFDSTSLATDTTITDTTTTLAVKRTISIASLQFYNNDASAFYPFFASLDSAKLGKLVQIYHYGDSQIECDRMTGVLREKLQEKFGGNGPGLISPLPVAATTHCSQSQSDSWQRYTAYGYHDAKAKHNKYGPMCSYARFTPALKKQAIDSTNTKEAWFEMRPSGMAQMHSKTFHSATMYFGNNLFPFNLTVLADDKPVWQNKISVSASMQKLNWTFATTPKRIRFLFSGADSPDVYAVALRDTTGVLVNNIAMRGNDGNTFKKINSSEIVETYNDLGTDLIILQFGGNAVPHLRNEASARAYGQAFQAQIRYVKQCAPNAAIMVIGPSDMSTTFNGEYITWPHLEQLNEGMKEAAFAEGCAFWDMFAVMGGKNSMASWVTNKPPYAGPDYTHFTKAGANKMAELLYKAIDDEYMAWKSAFAPL